jgi:hypothetical protein
VLHVAYIEATVVTGCSFNDCSVPSKEAVLNYEQMLQKDPWSQNPHGTHTAQELPGLVLGRLGF